MVLSLSFSLPSPLSKVNKKNIKKKKKKLCHYECMATMVDVLKKEELKKTTIKPLVKEIKTQL